jgi:hypothetical protein
MKRRILSCLFAASLFLGMFPSFALATPDPSTITLTIADTVTAPGSQFTAIVALVNSVPITGISFKVVYPSASFELTSAANIAQSLESVITGLPNNSGSKMFTYNVPETDPIAETGDILRLTFTVKETAAVGTNSISLSEIEASDADDGGVPQPLF